MAPTRRSNLPPTSVPEEQTFQTQPVDVAPGPAAPGGYDYNQAQSSWFNAAPGTNIDQWIAANPTFTQGITSSKGGEWMNLPGGESFDAQRNFGPGQSPQWGSQNYDYNTGKAYSPQEAQAAEAQWASQHPGGAPLGGGGFTGNWTGSGGQAGAYGGVAPNGNDPFSQTIQNGITSLIAEGQNRLHSTPQQQAIAMEAARSPYEAARKVQLRNAEGTLADRGTLGEPGQQSGLLADAVGRIETNLAPSYTAAIANGYGQMADREQGWANTLGNTLTAGTNRQSALSDIAIRTLEQNRLFDQFVATYGLDKARTLSDIQNGQDDRTLKLFELYLKQAEIAGNGHI